MADQTTANPDGNVDLLDPAQAPVDEPTPDGSPAATDGEQFVFKRFKTQEEVQKGYSELESAYTKSRQEVAEVRRERERLEIERQVAMQLAGERTAPVAVDPERAHMQRAELIEVLDKEGAAKLLELLDARDAEALERDRARQAEIADLRDMQDPEYQENKALVEAVVKKSKVPRKVAIEIVKTMRELNSNPSPPPPTPGGVGGGLPRREARQKKEYSNEDRQLARQMGLSEKDLA